MISRADLAEQRIELFPFPSARPAVHLRGIEGKSRKLTGRFDGAVFFQQVFQFFKHETLSFLQKSIRPKSAELYALTRAK